jgi:peptide/nickel transport system substrate-binding protein
MTRPHLNPAQSAEMAVNGKQGKIEKVNETTVRLTFPEPYPLFMEVLGGTGFVGGSQSMRGDILGGLFAPAHYLKQFLPKYTPLAQVEQMAKDAKFDGWVNFFKFKNTWRLNTELPVLTPWKTTSPINTPNWVLERNPFYYAVDTEGNQLPYIDKIQMTLAENLEVLNLRAIAGEYDWQERHTGLGKLPVFLENQQKGNYTVHLDPAANGCEAVYYLNQSWDADPEIAKWLRNRDFRHALSLGIDRDQLNETFWLGVGSPGSVVPDSKTIYSPGEEWRTKWSVLDLAQANELLDKVGLTKKDSEGFRERTDGKGRLRLEIFTIGGTFVPATNISEMVAQHWKKIGIQATITELERSLAEKRIANNELPISVFGNDGSDFMFATPSYVLPVVNTPLASMIGPAFVPWYVSNGVQGPKPEDPEMIRGLELFRAASGQEADERKKTGQEIWKILAEETYGIGTVGLSPAVLGVRIVKNTMGNVPAREINANYCRTPSAIHPSTLFFKS